ncbi:hypothetical protein LINPERPRIM_LOCUS6128 [Linum perenne]
MVRFKIINWDYCSCCCCCVGNPIHPTLSFYQAFYLNIRIPSLTPTTSSSLSLSLCFFFFFFPSFKHHSS